MLEILKYIFSSFWIFAGVLILSTSILYGIYCIVTGMVHGWDPSDSKEED